MIRELSTSLHGMRLLLMCRIVGSANARGENDVNTKAALGWAAFDVRTKEIGQILASR